MSGAEEQSGFVWIFTLGNLATMVALGTGIAGIIAGIVRFTKGFGKTTTDLKDTLLLSNAKLDGLSDKVKSHEETTNAELKRNMERIEEVKWMMQEITKRIEENKVDISRRVDDRAREIQELDKKLDSLKEEYYKLNMEIVRKINRNEESNTVRATRSENRMSRHAARGEDVEGYPHGQEDEEK